MEMRRIMQLDNLIALIKKNSNYKITEQRKAILEVLIMYSNSLISAENILQNSKTLCTNINLSTIYRNLEILEHLNLLFKVITDEGISLYKLECCNEHHHHIICQGCGRTAVLDYCPIKNITLNNNFYVTGHKLELYGYCDNCKKEPNE